MTDTTLAQRLRDQHHMTQGDGLGAMLATANEAAATITRLTADNKALTAEVEMLRDVKHSSHWKARAEGAEQLLAVQIAGHQLSAKTATANLMRATAAESDRDDWRKLHDAAQRVVSERNAALNAVSAELAEARKDLDRAGILVRLVTVRQVIDAGDRAINAAGLNPWCMNEGLADGGERISPSFLVSKEASHAG